MIDKLRLKTKAEALGVRLGETQLEQFACYAKLLMEWNQRMNLTAITDAEDIEDKHFIDCMVPALQPELTGKLVDVGSGAGFPGLVIKILRPEIELTLMEPSQKRCGFLKAVAAALNVEATIITERGEEAARKAYREKYDTATARAVAALPALCEFTLPLVKPGGFFIAMKADITEELTQSTAAIRQLGGGDGRLVAYVLPNGAHRTLVVVPKIAPTPDNYPRNGGVIKKRPL